ncbi:MAG: 16S rRNA (cytosine(1402)-N(4))-methyltransferase [Desulfobacterales bacterium S3730MH5]|nr:MAG: 16S rRNA (cytosine(1402)-N(4))-methyltransferase [Desulfobacterales bacterium S3730MH5]
MQYRHDPVMVKEVIDHLNCSPGKTYVDGTLGGGGHAQAILEAIGPDGCLLGIDRDPDAIVHAGKSLHSFKPHVQIFHGDFADLPQILSRLHMTGVDGILLDLGLSLYQLKGSGRGFSFMRDEPLDMRMNPEQGHTAATLVNRLSKKDLADLIARYGEESWAKRIARHIVDARSQQPIRSSLQFAEIVKKAVPVRHRRGRIHPATRTFQAIRIAVNKELDALEKFLDGAADLLNPGGRLCILSFHSLEDRIVKQRFKALARGCTCPPDFPKCVCGKTPQVSILTKKPVRPGQAELQANPLARSARLRAAERC